MNVQALFQANTFIALVAAALLSHVASAVEIEQVVRVRTARVDKYRVAVTSDQGLFGIDCERGNLVFPNLSGRIPMGSYDSIGSTSMMPPGRTRSVAIEAESLNLLCSDPISSEFLLVITQENAVVRFQSKGGLFKIADSSVARPYMIDDLRVAVTDRFRLVGFDCEEKTVVLQNHDALLPMNLAKSSRFAPYRENRRAVTDGSLDHVCSKHAVMSGFQLNLVGLQTQQVSVVPVSVNAQIK